MGRFVIPGSSSSGLRPVYAKHEQTSFLNTGHTDRLGIFRIDRKELYSSSAQHLPGRDELGWLKNGRQTLFCTVLKLIFTMLPDR